MSEYFLRESSQKASPESNAPSTRSGLKRRIYLGAVLLAVAAFLGYFIYLVSGLPDLTDLENVHPAQATRLYDVNGEVIHELFKYSRIWVPYDAIPQHVVEAALATEDREFYDHWGINLKRVIKPIVVNIINLSYVEGFSTITMQVARNLYVKKIGFERSISRKLREILTAIQIERTYSKQEILEMYLNVSYFGRGAYGIKSAAKKYFNKDVNELTIDEGALLIALLKGPAYYSPTRHPERALLRRNVVLHNMLICDYLNRAEFDTLKQVEVVSEDGTDRSAIAPYFTEYVRLQLNDLQKELGVNVYEDGLNVYTTLDVRYQGIMDSVIKEQLPVLQEDVNRKLKEYKEENEIPDSVFAEKAKVQIAMVALDHHNGEIRAMVGGRDFDESKFNRAIQAKRQPGSTFKPFLYAAAIDNGYNPSDKLLNQPVVLVNPDGTRWTPENDDRTFGGLTTLRTGLRRSMNLISARLILEIGPQTVVDYAHRLGIKTRLRPYPSLAMGSSDVIPLEMISAFGVFANQGIRVEPVSIRRIEDRYGNIIYRSTPQRSEALNRSTAYIITDMLEDVVNNGTGARSRWMYKFHAPAAGKTGTTNEYTDAWFIGYTPRITSGVWVGLDSPEMKLGKGSAGNIAALPFWAKFMKTLYDSLDIPEEKFQQPPDIVALDICEDSGKIATNFCPNVIKDELFRTKDRPTETCPVHPGVTTTNRFKKVY